MNRQEEIRGIYRFWLHGVLRIHGSWAKPDMWSGMFRKERLTAGHQLEIR